MLLKFKHNLDEFTSVVSEFVKEIRRALELQVFDRVGFRIIYFLETKTWEDANALLMETQLVKIPSQPCFSFAARAVSVEPIMLFTGDEVAARVRIASRKRRIDFDPPPELNIESIHRDSFGVLFDIDYYTVVRVGVSQMEFTEWIHTVHRHIRRDATKFLERS